MSNATNTTITTTSESALEQLSLMVVAGMASGIALLIFVVIQLLYRSTNRHSRLVTIQRRLRFDARYIVEKHPDLGEILQEDSRVSREQREKLLKRPPMAIKRVLPTIHDGRDAKVECRKMLFELRTALGSTFGVTANMTMRTALQCIQGALDAQDVERFSIIYDAVLFGVHRADGTCGDVSSDDLKFLTAYFAKVMKEL